MTIGGQRGRRFDLERHFVGAHYSTIIAVRSVKIRFFSVSTGRNTGMDVKQPVPVAQA